GARCRTLPLANFGTLAFSASSARTVDGHTGTITDPAWSATAIQLQTGSGSFRRFAAVSGAGASPSAVSADGSAFSVAWQQGVALPRRARPQSGGLKAVGAEPSPSGPRAGTCRRGRARRHRAADSPGP